MSPSATTIIGWLTLGVLTVVLLVRFIVVCGMCVVTIFVRIVAVLVESVVVVVVA
jgi:hypothetical protein